RVAVVLRSAGVDRSAKYGPRLQERVVRKLDASARSARFFPERCAPPAPDEPVHPRAGLDGAPERAPGKSAKCTGHGFAAVHPVWRGEDLALQSGQPRE